MTVFLDLPEPFRLCKEGKWYIFTAALCLYFVVEILLSRETKNNQNWCGYEKNNRIYLNLSYSLFYLHTFVRFTFLFQMIAFYGIPLIDLLNVFLKWSEFCFPAPVTPGLFVSRLLYNYTPESTAAAKAWIFIPEGSRNSVDNLLFPPHLPDPTAVYCTAN